MVKSPRITDHIQDRKRKNRNMRKDELWKKSVIRHIQDRACTYLSRVLASETERGFTSALAPCAPSLNWRKKRQKKS